MRGVANDFKSGLTRAMLRKLFDYNASTGKLIRRMPRGTRWYVGEEVGSLNPSNGYRYVHIDKRIYTAHRLIWLYVNGRFPQCDIDHINGDRDDNRLVNLREATRGQNNVNSGLQKNNTSGHKGAYYDKRRDCWYAELWIDNKKQFLGRYSTASEAGAAYQTAARRHFGEFVRAA